jgi:predicted O-methyltransferase YrrM
MININNLPQLASPTEILPYCETVDAEREFTTKAIAYYKPKNILEVGVSAGGSTVVLLDAIKDLPDARVTSVDIGENWYQNTSRAMGWIASLACPHNSQWTLHKGKDFSEITDSITNKFDFLLLDTMHIHPCESLNFLTILPYLTDNAVIVLHDIGLFSNPFRASSNACKLLYDVVTAEKYECFDYEYQLTEHAQNKVIHFPNIGAFQINPDTRKYIRDVFSMLRYPWGFHMPRLGAICAILKKHYDDECLRMFKSAVAVNLSYLFCGCNYDFSPITNVFCKIASNEIKVSDSLRRFNRIIFHGAGNLCKTTLSFFEAFDLPRPKEIWDINFENVSVDGYDVVAPDYDGLDENDLVVVTIQNYMTAHAITANAVICRCAKIIALQNLAEKLNSD